MMWDDTIPSGEMKWEEWHRHCDEVLDYYKGYLNVSTTTSWSDNQDGKWLMGWEHIHRGDNGNGWLMSQEEWDISRFHYTTQNGIQYKTYELLFSGLSIGYFWNSGSLLVTETAESKTADKKKTVEFQSRWWHR